MASEVNLYKFLFLFNIIFYIDYPSFWIIMKNPNTGYGLQTQKGASKVENLSSLDYGHVSWSHVSRCTWSLPATILLSGFTNFVTVGSMESRRM